jgi:hypothetical protein
MLDCLVTNGDIFAGEGLDPGMVNIARTLAAARLADLSRVRTTLRHRLQQYHAGDGNSRNIPLMAAFSMGFAAMMALLAVGLLIALPLTQYATDASPVAEVPTTPSLISTKVRLAVVTFSTEKQHLPTVTPVTPSPTLPPPAAPIPSSTPLAPATATLVPTASPTATETQFAVVAPEDCSYDWFTAVAPVGSCPSDFAVAVEAAYQPFEHGAMIWRVDKGYIVLPFDPSSGQQQGAIMFATDPLTIYRDTSADYTPPSGLYAPVSGFGEIWRGDHVEQEGSSLLNLLGWGLAPEVGYTITEQAGTLTFKQGETTIVVAYTYLTLPDGTILELSRLAEPFQPTSLRLLTTP